jgi:hypothetical protein
MAARKDFHLHSKASDGVWRPERVVFEAMKHGLETIALTDHDTTFGLREAIETGKKGGVEVVPGIEIGISDIVGGVEVDDFEILGLYIDPVKIENFGHELASNRRASLQQRLIALNAFLEDSNFERINHGKKYPLLAPREITPEEVVAWKNQRYHYVNPDPILLDFDIVMFLFCKLSPSLGVAMKYLSGEKGIMGEVKAEYPFLFGIPQEGPSFERAITEVHKAGGIAVLAHPGRSRAYASGLLVKYWDNPDDSQEGVHSPALLVSDLQAKGLDGIEMYYYQGNCAVSADEENRINTFFKRVADQLDLQVTYGSDCHGPRGKPPLIGRFGQP